MTGISKEAAESIRNQIDAITKAANHFGNRCIELEKENKILKDIGVKQAEKVTKLLEDNKYEICINPYDFKTAQFVTKEIYDLIGDLDKEIEKLKKDRYTLNKALGHLYEDVSNGEHLDEEWITETIRMVSRDLLVEVLNKKIKKLEAENEKLMGFYYIVKKYQTMSTYAPDIIDDTLKQLELEK